MPMTKQQIQEHMDRSRASGWYGPEYTDDMILQDLKANGYADDNDIAQFRAVTPTEAVTTGGLPTPVGGTTPTQAPTPIVPDGNYNQVQNAVQGGQFGTAGTSDQTSTQTTQQTTQGTQKTTPDDVYGFGQLLRDQAGGATATDAARTSWLTDVMNTGGTGFQQQLDAGIRNSLSGPQMTGAGGSAQARAAGYAAANVGRNNMGERLGAAQQLAGGNATGLTALASAAQPYGVGQTTSTTGSTSGLSNLITQAKEAQAGTTAAQSSQAGAGQIPEGQPVKTGGCVLCTAAIELRLSKHHRVLRKVIKHKLVTDAKRFHPAAKGYFTVFTPLADWLIDHPRMAKVLWPLAKAVVYEELRVAGRKLPLRTWAWMVHWTGHAFCDVIGRALPVRGFVTNPRILSIARREGILYHVEG